MEPAVLVRGICGRPADSWSARSLAANRSRISCRLFMLLLHEPNASNHSAAESAFVIDDSKSSHIANAPKLGEAGAASFVHNPRPAQCRIVPRPVGETAAHRECAHAAISRRSVLFYQWCSYAGVTKLQTARELGIEVLPEGLHRRRGDRAACRRAAPHPSLATNGRVGSRVDGALARTF